VASDRPESCNSAAHPLEVPLVPGQACAVMTDDGYPAGASHGCHEVLNVASELGSRVAYGQAWGNMSHVRRWARMAQ